MCCYLALKYEMQLAEVISESGGGREVTSERLELCFSILGIIMIYTHTVVLANYFVYW